MKMKIEGCLKAHLVFEKVPEIPCLASGPGTKMHQSILAKEKGARLKATR